MSRIGIFGGTFNPIHKGHIALAKTMLKALQLDEVWLLITPLNPFKSADTDILDNESRLLMAQTALRRQPGIVASDYEFHLPVPSYTWNTLQNLSRDFPEHAFTLIIGGDNWTSFPRWYHSEDILNNYPIAVYPRQNSPISSEELPQNVTLVDAPLYPISSTEIRQRVRDGRSISRFVPKSIEPLVRQFYQKKC